MAATATATPARPARMERQLLETPIRNAGRPVSRETVPARAWGYGDGYCRLPGPAAS